MSSVTPYGSVVPALQYCFVKYVRTGDPTTTVSEIFIPSTGIIFNAEGTVSPAKRARNINRLGEPVPTTAIELRAELVEKISAYMAAKAELGNAEAVLRPCLEEFWQPSKDTKKSVATP